MRTRGFEFATPAAAQASAARSEMSDGEQRHTALADVQCKKQVDLLATWFSVLERIESRLVGENRRTLATWRRSLLEADKRSRAVLSDS